MTDVPPQTERNPIKVLIVEDHLLTRLGLRSAIDLSEDIKVVAEAERAEQALQIMAQQPIDVLLLDLGLPDIDGIELAKRVKNTDPSVGIVVLTSHNERRDIMACFAAGASAYCTKEIKPDRLFTAIRSVHQGDVWLDQSIAVKVLQCDNLNYRESERGGVHNGIPDTLSMREREVLTLVVQGLTNQEIADRLVISLATAKAHVRSILNKLSVDDRTQAAVEAMKRGLV